MGRDNAHGGEEVGMGTHGRMSGAVRPPHFSCFSEVFHEHHH